MTCSVSQKIDTELGQAPTSQARRRDTDHLRPSNLAARTLSLVGHTLSKFGGDPCPVRRALAAAVKCYVRKARFSRCSCEQNERSQSLVWVSTPKRDNLFCFLFSGTIILRLTSTAETGYCRLYITSDTYGLLPFRVLNQTNITFCMKYIRSTYVPVFLSQMILLLYHTGDACLVEHDAHMMPNQ